MTTTLDIPALEHHVVRLFSVDLPAGEIDAFNRRNGTWPLRDALGADVLNAEALALFDVSDLEEIGLARYLQEGHGIAADQIDPIREALDGMQGYVLVLPSSALGDGAQTLNIDHPLKLVATLAEDQPPIVYDSLPTLASKAELGPAGFDSFARLPRRVVVISAALLLAILILLITVLYL